MASLTSAMLSTESLPMRSSESPSWTSPVSLSASALESLESLTGKKHWKLRFFLEPNASAWSEVHRLRPRLPRGWARRVLHSHGYVLIEGCGCDKLKEA